MENKKLDRKQLITHPDSDNYWVCIVGPIKRKYIPSDVEPRYGVQNAIIKYHNEKKIKNLKYDIWSGWGHGKEEIELMQNAKYIHNQLEKLKNGSFADLVAWWREQQSKK
jgi:hypothetical protein